MSETPKTKKENWLKLNIECSINTDTAPKWFKSKIKEIQKNRMMNEEQATKYLIKTIDTKLSKESKGKIHLKELFAK